VKFPEEKSSSAFEMSQKEMFLIITGIISDTLLVNGAAIDDLLYESAFIFILETTLLL
jgi:hypothetical protein